MMWNLVRIEILVLMAVNNMSTVICTRGGDVSYICISSLSLHILGSLCSKRTSLVSLVLWHKN